MKPSAKANLRPWSFVGAAAILLAAWHAAANPAPGPTPLDDVAEPLQPRQPLTAAEQDRLEALTLYSVARLEEHRGKEAEALRHYQRAFRLDPKALAACEAIVPLAMRLDRDAVALRYALKAAELDTGDPPWLKQLADYLAARGDFSEAAALYQRAIEARKSERPAADDVELWMAAGRVYHVDNQHARAAECFARAVEAFESPERFGLDEERKAKLLGEPAIAWSIIGDAFLAADRPSEAKKAFLKAHAAAPNEGLLAYHLARIDARAGKVRPALSLLAKYFDQMLDLEGSAPYELLADLLAKQNKSADLVPRLEKLRAADPENASLGYFLAEEYMKAGRFDEAEPVLAGLLKSSPTVAAYRHLVKIHHKADRPEALLAVLADLAEKTGGLDGLTDEDRALVADAAWTDRLIGVARDKLAKDQAALSYAERFAAALIALAADRYDVAGEFFALAIEANADAKTQILGLWGTSMLAADRHADAAAVFQRGLDDPALADEYPVFNYYLSTALEMGGRTDEALAVIQTAVDQVLAASAKAAEDKTPEAAGRAKQLEQSSARYTARAAWIRYHAKRYDEAATAYRAIIDRRDADHSSGQVREVLREARLVLSNIAVLKDDIPQAVEWLEQVLDEFPDDISALNDLGYLWADANKNLHRAEPMIRKALEGDPENGAYRDSLGWVLYRLGRYPEAIAELEKAAGLEPDPVVLDHLGDAYQAAGLPDKAKESWQKAAEAHRKAGEAAKAEAVEKKLAGP